jgi:hypothetical protein
MVLSSCKSSCEMSQHTLPECFCTSFDDGNTSFVMSKDLGLWNRDGTSCAHHLLWSLILKLLVEHAVVHRGNPSCQIQVDDCDQDLPEERGNWFNVIQVGYDEKQENSCHGSMLSTKHFQ